MKIITSTILLVFMAAMATTSRADLLDTSVEGSTRIEISKSLNSIKNKLPAQEAADLGSAVVCLTAECIKQVNLGMSKDESDSIFVGLTKGQTPRQIILIAAGILISQSASILDDPEWASPEKLTRAETARRRDLYGFRSLGIGLLERYSKQTGQSSGRS